MAVYKPFGFTPLQVLDLLRENHVEYKNQKLSYAGRLDPMAEGVMLVVTGEENKTKQKYLELPKEYEFEILFGVATDTGDILGLSKTKKYKNLDFGDFKNKLRKILPDFLGRKNQTYPAYSSPLIAGKSEFEKEVEIFSLKLVSVKQVTLLILKKTILTKLKRFSKIQIENPIRSSHEALNLRFVPLVWPSTPRPVTRHPASNGVKDFRQDRIIKTWEKFFKETGRNNFMVAKLKVTCSSGTYVRVLAEAIGKKLDMPACAFSIKRTKVGDWSLGKSLKLR